MPLGRYVEVAVEGPIRTTFHYEWGSRLGEIPAPGSRVVVPFGPKRLTGYVLREVPEEEARASAGGRNLREVAYLKDRESFLTPGVLELARWIARHYMVGLGDALASALPAGVRKEARAAREKIATAILTAGELAALAESVERKSPKRAAALRRLMDSPELSAADLSGGKSDSALIKWLTESGVIQVREVRRDGREAGMFGPFPPMGEEVELNRAQAEALETVHRVARVARTGEAPHGLLLEGVTASGKTEIYLRAIAEEIAAGRQAIVLVPEIALTPQTVLRFGQRFSRLAVLHSHMTDGARAEEWRRIKSGQVDVAIGPRSAVFAPFERLGLIVVDEEHEFTYKQESSPRYHARDVALRRARIEKALVILGSATPSLESLQAAAAGELAHAVLPGRIGDRPLPPVDVVDMRRERQEMKGHRSLSRRLEILLRETLRRGEQAILFLNRRGYSTFLHCPRCGTDFRCERCDVPMTLHAKQTGLMPLACHYCGSRSPIPSSCAACGSGKLLPLGTGTERVVEEVQRALPSARILRMDTDSMARQEDYEKTLAAFGSGEGDVLVGTQMIAKGLDLPRVTLVGVVNADVALHMPDFRASERAFSLIAQVAGRAGRSDLGGRVVVQTDLPDALPIRMAAAHDVRAFAAEELKSRRAFGYPPFGHLVRIVVEGEKESAIDKKADAIAAALREAQGQPAAFAMLGPAEAPLGKLRGRRRQHIIVKAPDAETLEALLWESEKALRGTSSVRVTVDVDPVNMR